MKDRFVLAMARRLTSLRSKALSTVTASSKRRFFMYTIDRSISNLLDTLS